MQQEPQQEPKEPQQEPKEPKQAEPPVQEPNQTLEALADLKKEVTEFKAQESQKQSALDDYKKQQQQDAVNFFQDEGKKKALLSSMSQEEATNLLSDIEAGKVTRRELEVRAQLSQQKLSGPKEATVVPINNKADSISHASTIEGINKERMEVIRNMRHPYNDPRHSGHAEAVKHMKALEQKRDSLEAQAGNR